MTVCMVMVEAKRLFEKFKNRIFKHYVVSPIRECANGVL